MQFANKSYDGVDYVLTTVIFGQGGGSVSACGLLQYYILPLSPFYTSRKFTPKIPKNVSEAIPC